MWMLTAALFTTAKMWKQPKFHLTDEWMNKMQYSSAIEKNEVLTEATKRMDVESMMQSERRPLQKTTQRMIPIKQTP